MVGADVVQLPFHTPPFDCREAVALGLGPLQQLFGRSPGATGPPYEEAGAAHGGVQQSGQDEVEPVAVAEPVQADALQELPDGKRHHAQHGGEGVAFGRHGEQSQRDTRGPEHRHRPGGQRSGTQRAGGGDHDEGDRPGGYGAGRARPSPLRRPGPPREGRTRAGRPRAPAAPRATPRPGRRSAGPAAAGRRCRCRRCRYRRGRCRCRFCVHSWRIKAMAAGERPDSGWRRIPVSYLGCRGGGAGMTDGRWTARGFSLSLVRGATRPAARGPRHASALGSIPSRTRSATGSRPFLETALSRLQRSSVRSSAGADTSCSETNSGGSPMSKRILFSSLIGVVVLGGVTAGGPRPGRRPRRADPGARLGSLHGSVRRQRGLAHLHRGRERRLGHPEPQGPCLAREFQARPDRGGASLGG